MKSTGIVRKLDELGRVVLPIELRRTLNLNEKDALEVFVEEENIILRKYKPSNACAVTGEVHDDNVRLENGLVLSVNGAKLLLDDLTRKGLA